MRARRAGTLPPRTRLAGCPPAALGGKAGGWRRDRESATLRTAFLLLPGPLRQTRGSRNFTDHHPLLAQGRTGSNYGPGLLGIRAKAASSSWRANRPKGAHGPRRDRFLHRLPLLPCARTPDSLLLVLQDTHLP